MAATGSRRSRGSGSRTRSCSRPRRRPSPTATSCGRSTPAGAASSPRPSACTRSSTSPGRRRSSCARRRTRRTCRCRSGPGTALHSSWNWELISDKTLDWWVPRIAPHQEGASGSHSRRVDHGRLGQRRGAAHWQTLAQACQDEGADALELNLSCPHMDRKDMGSNIGKDQELISIVTQAVKEVARVPIWAKLTPSTTDIVVEARGAFLGGADAITSSNTFPSLPAHRSGDARVRDERRRLRLERRPRRPGDPAAVAGEDGAADAGVSRQGVLGHRRRRRVRARAQLLPARLRHGAGVHGRDARSRDRPERASSS